MITNLGKRVLIAILGGIFLIEPCLVIAKKPNDLHVDQWAYEHIGAYDAWDYTTGSEDVVVAVIDNGFDTFHPDLYDNVWTNEKEIPNNGNDDDSNGYVDDIYGWNFVPEDFNGDGQITGQEQYGNNDPRPVVDGLPEKEKSQGVFNHGTLVAGLIGSVGNNSKDGVGINWNVRLMNLKVLGNSGTGTLAPLDKAITYAVRNGADVINISMVGEASKAIKAAIEYAYVSGVVVVAAAGNSLFSLNDYPMYPVCADYGEKEQWVLGVSAIDITHHIARFSNTGSDCVDITAPGVNVSSTVRYSPKNGLKDRYAGGWDGTSFATPMVSGAAALLKAIHPNWKPKQIYNAILSTVQHTPGQDEVVYANLFGAGLLQISKAVKYVPEKTEEENWGGGILDKILAWTGENTTQYSTDGKEELLDTSFLNLKDDVATYLLNDETYFVSSKNVGKTKSRIEIFNPDGERQDMWIVDSSGKLNITIGDVQGDDEPEIVLAPDYADTLAYKIFDLRGKKILEKQLDAKHNGVSITLASFGLDKKEILLFYNNQKGLWIHEFSGTGQDVGKFHPRTFANRGQIGSGDFDGDGETEYVVSTAPGQASLIGFFEKDGQLIKKFSVYESGYREGIQLATGDYNKDGKEEVIVGCSGSVLLIKIWSIDKKVVAELLTDKAIKRLMTN